jgi:hypothetical protein
MTAKPIDAARLSEIVALCARMRCWHDEDLASAQACVSCESSVHTPSDLEPTPLCDLCAQRLVNDVPNLLAEIARLQFDLGHATSHEGDHLSKASRRMVDTVMGDRDALRAAVARLRTEVEQLSKRPLRTFDHIGGDRLADEVAVLIRRKAIDARSPAGDALLDYREPPSTERADRMAVLETENERLAADVLRLTETARSAAENWMAACRQRDEARAESEQLRQRVRDQDEELQAHAQRGWRELLEEKP